MVKKKETKFILRLFVAGLSPKSLKAINNVKKLSDKHMKDNYDLEIIDIYQKPEAALSGEIIAAPTLIKELPKPLKKFVGDMSAEDKILAGLFLKKE